MTGGSEAQAIAVSVSVGLAGYRHLADEWQALALAAGSHFLHFPAWYGAQLATAGDRGVYFLALREGSRLFAVLPLEHTQLRRGPLRLPVLRLYYPSEMGVNDVLSDRSLAPYRTRILAALRRHLPYFLWIGWSSVPQTGCAMGLRDEGADLRYTHSSKYIDFSAGAEAFWAGYSSKFRRGLQQKMRRAQAQGTLRLLTAKEPDALSAAFADFLAVEDSGWKGRQGTSILQQPQKRAYYQALMAAYGALCRIHVLYLDEVPIAAQFGVQVGGVLHLLKIGYREDCAALSPGYLLLAQLVDTGAHQGTLTRVSFVTGVDWIDRWHPGAVPVGVFYSARGDRLSRCALRVLAAVIALRRRNAPADPQRLATLSQSA